MHPSAYNDAQKFVDSYLDKNSKLKIADIGSYNVNGCLRPLFDNPNWEYVGFDICEGPNVDIVINEEVWPSEYFGLYDVVISTQVLEHTRRPWLFIENMAKFCRTGGLIYVCTPHTIGYHPYPIDCWRVYPSGLGAIMGDASIEIIELYMGDVIDGIGDTTGIGIKQ